MLIENIEALRLWLMKTLTPICDADPNTLSQYVVALLKKPKTDKDLKEFCLDQLDVFLQTKTKGFVETLFETLTSKSYLALAKKASPAPSSVTVAPPAPPPTTDAAPSAPSVLTPVSQNQITNQQIALRTEKRKKSEEISDEGTKSSYRRHSGSPPRVRGRDVRDGDRDDRRRRYDDRNRFPERRYGREDSGRRRSRSRSRERSPRNRSRGPPLRSRPRSRSPYRGRSRSRSRSVSPPRSPMGRRTETDSRGSTPIQDNGKFTTEGDTETSAIPVASAITVVSRGSNDTRYDWNNHGRRNTPPPPRPRCKDYDEKGFCMRGDMCPFDHGLDPVIVEDINIPPVLPFPPGHPPPPPPGMPSVRPVLPNMTGPPPPLPGPRGMGPRPPIRGPRPPPPPGQERLPHDFPTEGYNPEAPAITAPRGGFWAGPRGPHPNQPFISTSSGPPSNNRNRDLVQVRTVPEEKAKNNTIELEVPGKSENGQTSRTVVAPKRSYNEALASTVSSSSTESVTSRVSPDTSTGPPPHKKHFDYNRLGSYRQSGYNSDNATLEVRKIPPEFNNIAKLNEHFGKFGTLVNIQVRHENNIDAALVTFSSNSEAYKAYRSSEPVFNNRFIKVFWHTQNKHTGANSSPSDGSATSSVEDQRIPVKVRVNIPSPDKLQLNNLVSKHNQHSDKELLYTPSVGVITKTVFNPAALKSKVSPPSPTALAELMKSQAEDQQRKKEALKKKIELQKQKQQLLQKYIEQQKLLLGKLEKNKSMLPEEKAPIMKTIKELSVQIDKLKSELTSKKSSEGVSTKSDVQAKKEILDTELELISRQHAGDDTSDLRKKLDDLTREAASMGLLGASRGRGRGRGSHVRGRGRGSTTWSRGGRGARGRGSFHQPASRTLDRRPRQLKITGFPEEERNNLLLHLAQHGEVENIDFEGNSTAIVMFKTRMDAEKVTLHAGLFKGKPLIMKWHTPGSSSGSALLASDDEDDDDDTGGGLDEIDEDALLAPDDEEEDDEESRSWRR